MTDPITLTRDDGSSLTLSRAEIVRAMAAMRAEDARGPASGPVCTTCGDTHRMSIGADGDGDDRVVPCTRCPVPCWSCASAGGRGAYCATPRCSCACHGARAVRR